MGSSNMEFYRILELNKETNEIVFNFPKFISNKDITTNYSWINETKVGGVQ